MTIGEKIVDGKWWSFSPNRFITRDDGSVITAQVSPLVNVSHGWKTIVVVQLAKGGRGRRGHFPELGAELRDWKKQRSEGRDATNEDEVMMRNWVEVGRPKCTAYTDPSRP